MSSKRVGRFDARLREYAAGVIRRQAEQRAAGRLAELGPGHEAVVEGAPDVVRVNIRRTAETRAAVGHQPG